MRRELIVAHLLYWLAVIAGLILYSAILWRKISLLFGE